MTRTLLVINPNTTEAMTTRLVAEAARFAGAHWQVRGATARFGEPVIASRAAFAIAAHAALDAYAASTAAYGTPDAVLLGCFGDPGLAALREVAGVPVVGLAQAAIDAARTRRFAIVTAGAAWRAMLQEVVLLAGAAAQLVDVFVLEGTGLDVAKAPAAFEARVRAQCEAAAARGAEVVILGGAGFAGMAAAQPAGAVPLIDCIAAATQAAVRACATSDG